MTKVCHITTVHSPFDTRIFYREAESLEKAGYEVILVAPGLRDETRENIRIVAVHQPSNRIARFFFFDRKIYQIALNQEADVYHFHDPEFLPCAIKLKRATKAKVIYDVHEDVPQQILSKGWVPQFFRGVVSKIFNIYEKSRTRKLDFVIAAWPKIKEKFQRAGINNIETITNYPLLEHFEQKKDNKKQITNNSEIKLIYEGGLTRVRGIKEIVKSLGYLKNKRVKLIIIGKFQEKGLEEELKRMTEWKGVEFKGWLNHKLVCQELIDADIGLICLLPTPNHINSFPNKLFEYMAAGLPVIASNFTLWKEIIEKNQCGLLVNPREPKEIARTIEYLIEHPIEARKMGENGRKAVFEKYNWKAESKKLLKIYNSLSR